MTGITTSLLGERVLDEWAVDIAGLNHALDQLEILARLLFVPGRGPGREWHQVKRRVVDRVANNASRVARTFGKEDGFHLDLEELVIQRRRCSWGRRWLALRQPQWCARRQEQTRYDDRKRRGPPHLVHGNLPQIFPCKASQARLAPWTRQAAVWAVKKP